MKCGGKPKMQPGGQPRQEDYPDYESWASAMDNWTNSLYDPEVEAEQNAMSGLKNFFDKKNRGLSTNAFKTTGNEGTDSNPMGRGPVEKNPDPVESTPEPKLDPYWLWRGFRNGMSWLSGKVERGRQNRYDWMQQTALGQMNPMPTDDFQPNPYNLYMEKGGNLKTILREHDKYTNTAQMDMGDGKLDDKGMMKKGGYEIDRMIITRRILPLLLQFGRLGTSKYRRMQPGGILPNKARQILHDKEVYGKPLTDKQRRYFGAMSKGHTNFRGK